jgi:putative endonuclease
MKRGTDGELRAAAYVEQLGYRVHTRNWRAGRLGELDLVAMDGDTLVIVEVKTARSGGFGDPIAWVDAPKRQQLGKLAEIFVASESVSFCAVRFDVISVDFRTDPLRITHLKDAFRPEP